MQSDEDGNSSGELSVRTPSELGRAEVWGLSDGARSAVALGKRPARTDSVHPSPRIVGSPRLFAPIDRRPSTRRPRISVDLEGGACMLEGYDSPEPGWRSRAGSASSSAWHSAQSSTDYTGEHVAHHSDLSRTPLAGLGMIGLDSDGTPTGRARTWAYAAPPADLYRARSHSHVGRRPSGSSLASSPRFAPSPRLSPRPTGLGSPVALPPPSPSKLSSTFSLGRLTRRHSRNPSVGLPVSRPSSPAPPPMRASPSSKLHDAAERLRYQSSASTQRADLRMVGSADPQRARAARMRDHALLGFVVVLATVGVVALVAGLSGWLATIPDWDRVGLEPRHRTVPDPIDEPPGRVSLAVTSSLAVVPPMPSVRSNAAPTWDAQYTAPERDTLVLYRILGNDLPPRHELGQTLRILRFMLQHEHAFPPLDASRPIKRVDKYFVLNRISDHDTLVAIVALLDEFGVARDRILQIPFEWQEYERAPMRWDGGVSEAHGVWDVGQPGDAELWADAEAGSYNLTAEGASCDAHDGS